MNLIEISQWSEEKCREYIESIVWSEGITCPFCHSKEYVKLQGKSTRPGLYKCKNKDCRKPYTVTMNTVMEDSHIPMKLWLMAIHLLCSSKKGFSAMQLKRELGIGSYRTAWFLLHRIRYAMENKSFTPQLQGTVEVDETYVGGKPRFHKTNKRGRGTKKTPVVALVERNGKAMSHPIGKVNGKELRNSIRKNIRKSARIITDDLKEYRSIGKEFDGGHQYVKHSMGEYVRGDVFTNTVESYFALIKRGHYGVYHSMSKQHLNLYCNEFNFRWNNRNLNHIEVLHNAISSIKDKRLSYR